MSEYLIPITIEPLKEGGYLATSFIWQGFIAQGRTISETLEISEDVGISLFLLYPSIFQSLIFSVLKRLNNL